MKREEGWGDYYLNVIEITMLLLYVYQILWRIELYTVYLLFWINILIIKFWLNETLN